MSDSVFNTLAAIDVANKTRGKNGMDYVTWSEAVRQLLKTYPEANWYFSTWGEGLPYLKTEAGCFVECTVVVGDIQRTQMLPVLNHKNQVLDDPDAFQVNKSQQRALTKAIALHGFGLQLWAGEDLDKAEEDRKANCLSEEEVANVIAKAEECGVALDIVCRKGRVNAIEDIESQRYNGLIRWIEQQEESK